MARLSNSHENQAVSGFVNYLNRDRYYTGSMGRRSGSGLGSGVVDIGVDNNYILGEAL